MGEGERDRDDGAFAVRERVEAEAGGGTIELGEAAAGVVEADAGAYFAGVGRRLTRSLAALGMR
jgi:hypothetical protein